MRKSLALRIMWNSEFVFFSFGFNIVDKKLVGAQNSRIKYFFADAGVRSCYEKMNKEGRIPPLWSEVIERAI